MLNWLKKLMLTTDISDFIKKADYNTKIGEIVKKTLDHDNVDISLHKNLISWQQIIFQLD